VYWCGYRFVWSKELFGREGGESYRVGGSYSTLKSAQRESAISSIRLCGRVLVNMC
jgi:hypothetical protein